MQTAFIFFPQRTASIRLPFLPDGTEPSVSDPDTPCTEIPQSVFVDCDRGHTRENRPAGCRTIPAFFVRGETATSSSSIYAKSRFCFSGPGAAAATLRFRDVPGRVGRQVSASYVSPPLPRNRPHRKCCRNIEALVKAITLP